MATIAIGFVKFSSVASGHTSAMSFAMSIITGSVRSPREMPPIPSVSAIV